MSKKSKKLIKYTDREFNSIKDNLVDYTKRYYPNVFKDFSGKISYIFTSHLPVDADEKPWAIAAPT